MSEAPEDLRARLRSQIAAIEGSGSSFRSRATGSSSVRALSSRGRDADFETSLPGRRGDSEPFLDHPEAHGAELVARSEGCWEGAAGSGGAKRSRGTGGREAAFRKIERLAASREQASTALRRRLVREGFDPDDVEEAVGRALACGLVDDARYADVLVRSRLAQGRGRQGIASELSDLDIDPEGVGALADADEEGSGELERALALLERRPPRAKNQRDAAYRRLVQKGFGADIAASAARLWTESKDA